VIEPEPAAAARPSLWQRYAEWLIAGAAFVLGAGTCGVRTLSEVEAPEPIVLSSAAPAAATTEPAPTAAPAPLPGPPRFIDALEVSAFLRGNLHTHSTRSDGDSPPAEVYAYYRDHGYAFLALTDHNTRTDPGDYRAEQRPGFVMIPAEEVTTLGAGKPVHVNALCSRRTIGGATFPTVREALGWAVARIKEQDAIALVNHPNFDWTLAADDLPTAHGAELLEVWSGHLYVHSEGDVLRPSHEALWTKMLDAGETFAGVAVDDMHNLLATDKEPGARPLRGWVEVFGAEATEAAICEGLRRGRLYASSGPKLLRLAVKGDSMTVAATAAAKVEFIGAEGAVLATVDAAAGKEARYKLRGGERYVRARITDKDGKRAWTQGYAVTR
jgi:hypothetical protein